MVIPTSNRSSDAEGWEKARLLVSRTTAVGAIVTQIEKGLEFKNTRIRAEEDYERVYSDALEWTRYNVELLGSLFSILEIREYYRFRISQALVVEPTFDDKVELFQRDLETRLLRLQFILDSLQMIPDPYDTPSTIEARRQRLLARSDEPPPIRKAAFITHGGSVPALRAVVEFLAQLGFQPIILRRHHGDTAGVLEKIEGHPDVPFAVVILTPEMAAVQASPRAASKLPIQSNIVFEWGVLVGKLKRKNVCALGLGNLEIPQEMRGFRYIDLDDGGMWQHRLAVEINRFWIKVEVKKAE